MARGSATRLPIDLPRPICRTTRASTRRPKRRHGRSRAAGPRDNRTQRPHSRRANSASHHGRFVQTIRGGVQDRGSDTDSISSAYRLPDQQGRYDWKASLDHLGHGRHGHMGHWRPFYACGSSRRTNGEPKAKRFSEGGGIGSTPKQRPAYPASVLFLAPNSLSLLFVDVTMLEDDSQLGGADMLIGMDIIAKGETRIGRQNGELWFSFALEQNHGR